MDREELNVYIDGLLSLGDSTPENRQSFIELAFYHDEWGPFIAEWLWLNKRGLEAALLLKVWLSWPYQDLAEVYGLDFRGVSQVLRTQRVMRLGHYPSAALKDLPQYGGLSCFMVEQQLSSWMDSEWEETSGLSKIKEHLLACADCRQRMGEYRKLHQELLQQRKSFLPISEDEWGSGALDISKRQRKTRWHWLLVIVTAVAFIGIILWMLESQPEKMPNIYEIKEI